MSHTTIVIGFFSTLSSGCHMSKTNIFILWPNHTSFDPHYAKFKKAVMRSARVKTKGIFGRKDHSESTLTTSLHKCLAQTVAKTCMGVLEKYKEWTRGEKVKLHKIVHQVALFEWLVVGPSLGGLSLWFACLQKNGWEDGIACRPRGGGAVREGRVPVPYLQHCRNGFVLDCFHCFSFLYWCYSTCAPLLYNAILCPLEFSCMNSQWLEF